MGPVSKKLYDTLTGIQFGKIQGPEGWVKVIVQLEYGDKKTSRN